MKSEFKGRLSYILSILLILIFIISSMLLYVGYMRKSVRSSNVEYLEEIFLDVAANFEKTFEQAFVVLDNAEKEYAENTYQYDDRILRYEKIIYYNDEYQYIDFDGNKGQYDIGNSKTNINGDDKQFCFDGDEGLSKKLIFAKSIDEKVIEGITYDNIGIVFDKDKFCEEYINIIYRDKANCYIVNNLGDVHFKFEGKLITLCKDDNVFDYIVKNDKLHLHKDKLFDSINNVSKVYNVNNYGTEKYIAITPLKNNELYMVSSIPASSVCIDINDFQNTFFWMTVFILACIISLLQIVIESKERLKNQESLETAMVCAKRANESKSRFLFNMSHDIRTPMNAIIGLSSLAEKNIDDKEYVRNCINNINVSSEHLLGLINDVLDMARIESGKMVLREEVFDLEKLMNNITTIINHQIQEKKIDYTCKVDVNNNIVYGDKLRLQQICMNILGNAVKFSNDYGKIEVIVTEKKIKDDKKNRYIFTIKDTGIGMDDECISKLFIPFIRGSNADDTKREGTGLGMSLTKSILDLLGGSIEVKSKLCKGSTFVVKIDFETRLKEDLLEKSESKNILLNSDSVTKSKNYSKRRIMIVDDKSINLEIMEKILERTGVIIEKAENGEIALKKYIEHEEGYYDIIFMDIQMPKLDGYETTNRIRNSAKKDAQDIIIIAMTASVFEEDIIKAISVGMNAHVAKPVRYKDINDIMEKYL